MCRSLILKIVSNLRTLKLDKAISESDHDYNIANLKLVDSEGLGDVM